MTFHEEAQAALAAKNTTERHLATAAIYPQWRHAIFGAMMGSIVIVPALPPAGQIAMFAAMICAVPLIMHLDRKRTGMFINGYRRGKTLYVTFAILALVMTLAMFSIYRVVEYDDRQTAFLLAPLAVAIGWVGGLVWQRVMIAELEG